MNNHLLLLTNIHQLIGILDKNNEKVVKMDQLNCIQNAYLIIKGEQIMDYGKMEELDNSINADQTIDLKGHCVLPSWNDSHTHLVFAGTREQEFVDRINGLSYQEIAARGGGIINSAKKLGSTSKEELFETSAKRLEDVMQMGTGAVEIKSGYGLDVKNELKMLQVIQQLKEKYTLSIKSTFLGAHALPSKYKDNKQGYLDLIINEMLPNIATEKLADYIDIFCETNYFSVEDMHQVLAAGIKHGLKPKVHVNQFTSIGGIQKALEFNAISVDHLEVMEEKDINDLKNSSTIATLLPSCSLFISIPYAPAKKLLKNNIPFALATDYNPGSSPNGNMNLVASLACIKMNISPEAAINAGTINGAYAMELSKKTGSITKGKLANLIVTEKITGYNYLPYSFGQNHIHKVMIKGKWI